MPQNLVDKVIRIVQAVLTVLQFALKAFGFGEDEDNDG